MELKQYPEDIDFGKYALILKRRWLPATSMFIATVILAVIFVATRRPEYEAQGKILLEKRDGTSLLLGESSNRLGELESLNQQNTPVDTEAEVLRSEPSVEQTIKVLGLKDKKGNLLSVDEVLKKLTAKGIKGTDLLQISYKSKNPKEAADVVNQMIATYIERNVLIKRTEVTAARKFITQQLPKTEAELREAEIQLRDFREQNSIVALDKEEEAAVETIAKLNDQMAVVQSDLASLNARVGALQRKIGLSSETATAVNALSQSQAVQTALEDLQKTEAQLASQRSRFSDTAPVIKTLEEKQANFKALLQARVAQVIGSNQIPRESLQAGESEQKLIDDFINTEISRLTLNNKLNALQEIRLNYRQRAVILPRLDQRQKELERQVTTAKGNYELLVKKLQEVQIAENQNVGNARVVAYASIPGSPISSKKNLIIAGGVLLGALLYVVTAFTLDLLDPSIKTVKDVRGIFKYPWLGMIPLLKHKHNVVIFRDIEASVPELPVRDNPHSLISESYRMLQSNLKFINPDQPVKTIVVTSSVPQEGKSTVSANLALALAQKGRKVLLVDADLYHPLQHHIWSLSNTIGLSDAIINPENLEEAIKQAEENLSVLSSGSLPPNPYTLIDSNSMANLVQYLRQKYDFIIFDTPPILLVSDVLTLTKMTDGMLLVVRPGVIDTATATTVREVLNQSSQKVLGLVINGVTAENEPSSYVYKMKGYGTTNDDRKIFSSWRK